MIRVVIPSQLGTLTDAPRVVEVEVPKPITLASILDALETAYPSLRGLLRDPSTGKRRPMIRFFAAEEDISHSEMNEDIGNLVAAGKNEIWIVAAISGGENSDAIWTFCNGRGTTCESQKNQ